LQILRKAKVQKYTVAIAIGILICAGFYIGCNTNAILFFSEQQYFTWLIDNLNETYQLLVLWASINLDFTQLLSCSDWNNLNCSLIHTLFGTGNGDFCG
jgi:hypothetical protein